MGLSLRTGATAVYQPMTIPAAQTAGAQGNQTIAQQAYGISGTGGGYVNSTPGIGALGVGVIATALLVYLWWSLPR